ncbi:MAG: hypothetical protein ACKPKO_06370 [Candidatus Fonsibacter sp.]
MFSSRWDILRIFRFAAMTAVAHNIANNVIKFLRWRNTSANGDVSEGFIGVAFDVSDALYLPVEYCQWVPAERGQAGYWLPHTSQRYFRDWVN